MDSYKFYTSGSQREGQTHADTNLNIHYSTKSELLSIFTIRNNIIFFLGLSSCYGNAIDNSRKHAFVFLENQHVNFLKSNTAK